MEFLKQFDEILSKYDLDWYNAKLREFRKHKDFDSSANKIITTDYYDNIVEDDSEDNPQTEFNIPYKKETSFDSYIYFSLEWNESDVNIRNAITQILSQLNRHANDLTSEHDKNILATEVFKYCLTVLTKKPNYSNKNVEYKVTIDKLLKDLHRSIFKRYVDTEKLTDFIKIKNQPLTLKPNLSKTVVDVFCNNLLDRCPNFIDEKYIEVFKSFLLQKKPKNLELNIDTNALAYIIYKLSDKFDIDEDIIESWFESIKTNSKPVLKTTYKNSISKFNNGTGLPKKSIKAQHIDDAIKITLDVIN